MNSRQTVVIVEDDINFSGLLKSIFDASEQFEVTNVFNSIDAFTRAFYAAELRQDWLPDLIVADLISGESVHHDAFSALLELRTEGYKFAILLMSGLKLLAAEKIARKLGTKNFEVLTKSSRIDNKTIIDLSLKSLEGLK